MHSDRQITGYGTQVVVLKRMLSGFWASGHRETLYFGNLLDQGVTATASSGCSAQAALGSWWTPHTSLMAALLRFEVPFRDDPFYDYIVIILTVVGVWGRICARMPRVRLCVDLFSVHLLVRFCLHACVFVFQLWRISSELRCVAVSHD